MTKDQHQKEIKMSKEYLHTQTTVVEIPHNAQVEASAIVLEDGRRITIWPVFAIWDPKTESGKDLSYDEVVALGLMYEPLEGMLVLEESNQV